MLRCDDRVTDEIELQLYQHFDNFNKRVGISGVATGGHLSDIGFYN